MSSSWTILMTCWAGFSAWPARAPMAWSRMRSTKSADDAEVDVGLEQGEADLAEDLVDVGLAEAALAAEALEDPVETVGQRLEHAVGQRTGPLFPASNQAVSRGRCRGRRSGGSPARRPVGARSSNTGVVDSRVSICRHRPEPGSTEPVSSVPVSIGRPSPPVPTRNSSATAITISDPPSALVNR